MKIGSDNQHTLLDYDQSLTLIGQGRSAYVFRIKQTDKALKVFFPDYMYIAEEEAEIYKVIQEITYYPTLYDAGSNYIVIDYIDGTTLFDCLTNGIPISQEVVQDIDIALQLAKQEGLNPSDVHLRNILITSNQQVKIIDVARFRQTKDCSQWLDLKKAFYSYYEKRYFPKKIPEFMLNGIAMIYKKNIFK
ncbi:protein kinase family protein [Viridibacillus arvi]|uniref:protein kinase family protein n=1 Tax=Viridibacillus arvi TaxID=263475 RepID=UPI001D13052F|nr:protein kinase family protein [Viridibacillus sp. JNUCC-6]